MVCAIFFHCQQNAQLYSVQSLALPSALRVRLCSHCCKPDVGQHLCTYKRANRPHENRHLLMSQPSATHNFDCLLNSAKRQFISALPTESPFPQKSAGSTWPRASPAAPSQALSPMCSQPAGCLPTPLTAPASAPLAPGSAFEPSPNHWLADLVTIQDAASMTVPS